MSVRSAPHLACLLVLTGAALPARADDELRISVVAILATDKNDTVDEKVACVAREMKKVDPKLTGFKLVKMVCKDVDVGKKECFELVDGQKTCVTLEKKADKDDRVCLKIQAPKLGEITYMTTCGKFFPVVTRYRTDKGEVLIVAVRVQPCKEAKVK